MSDAAIKVEGLGKKYLLRHQAGGRSRYVALRDVLAGKFKGLLNRKSEIGNRKSVEEFWALDGVSFEVKQGEAVGIIGRNGAGKSTLLKILSRITEPTRGRIEIDGRVASLLEVGTGFHPELTGRENIFLNGAILGMHRAEIRRKFDEIVAFADVEKFLDTPVKHFSSGMYMRLAFAVAAHLEPEILVVDEVLAVGDIEFQKKCLSKMDDVSHSGRTVLFVSHNMAAIRQLCTTGVVLETGKVKFQGKAADAIEVYSGLIKTAHEATFVSKPDKPGITRVRLNAEALARGDFEIEMGFQSPFPLNPPVPGFVIYSSSGVPVFASNPRFHKAGYDPHSLRSGFVSFTSVRLPICGGRYRLSVWLGDWHTDYDHRADILAFEFKRGEMPATRPHPDSAGYVDHDGLWKVEEVEAVWEETGKL